MADKINYEHAIARLEKIAETLEKGELSLDDSIQLYAEGTALAAKCSDELTKARLKITEITEKNGENNG